jgi:site-specific recombinase XerD
MPAPLTTMELLAAHVADLKECGTSKSHLDARVNAITGLAWRISPRPLSAATGADVEAFLVSRPLSKASQYTYRSHFRIFYRWMADVQAVAVDPALVRARGRGPAGRRRDRRYDAAARTAERAAAQAARPRLPQVQLTAATAQAVGDHAAWMLVRGLREATSIRQRSRAVTRVARALGGDLLGATPDGLVAWQAGLVGSAQTHCTYVAHLVNFYRWAMVEGLVETVPTGRLVRPKIARRVPRPISEDKLLTAMSTATPRVRVWLVLAGWAGLRAMEVASLRREDILERAPTPMLVVRDGKGQVGRAVPLSPLVVEELAGVLEGCEPGWWLFPRMDMTGPVTAKYVSTKTNKHLRSLGFPDTFHSLRHRFATELYRVTLDLRLVQEMLGHGSPATTAIYTAFSPTRAASAIQGMGTVTALPITPAPDPCECGAPCRGDVPADELAPAHFCR